MQIDQSLADQALNLADGTDVHGIIALVATYRTLAKEPETEELTEIASEFEHSLRAFVTHKRIAAAELASVRVSPPPRLPELRFSNSQPAVAKPR